MNKRLMFSAFLLMLFLTTVLMASANTVVAKDPNWENYSKGPHVDRITMLYKSEADQIPALKAGEINVSAWYIHPEEIKPLSTDPNIIIETNASFGFFYLAFNLRTLPFKGAEGKVLRQAIAHAIDKEEIARTALKGWGTPIDDPIHIGFGIWHNPNIKKYDFNLTLAAQMLHDAGFVDTDNDGIVNDPRDGKNVEFDILHPTQSYDPVRYTAGIMIANWLQQIGIGAHSAPTDFSTIVQKCFVETDFKAYILGWAIGDNSPDILYWFFHSSQDVAENPSGQNSAGFRNETFDRLAESTLSELNQTKLLQDVYKAQEILAEELPYICLFVRDAVYAHRIETVGWVNMPEVIMGQIGAYLSMLNVHHKDKEFGGTLYWGMVQYPKSINPYNPSSNDVWAAYIMNLLWDGLVSYDATLDLEPALAESWDVGTETIPAGTESIALEKVYKELSGKDMAVYVNTTVGGWALTPATKDMTGMYITWHLRHGLKWSDGTPFTAKDVNFTYYLALAYDNTTFSTGAIWKIDYIDDYTVTVHIALTDPFLVRHFAFTPRPEHVWKPYFKDPSTWTMGFDTTNDTLIAESTVGSGPFMWKEHHAGDYIILEKNPYYWNLPNITQEQPSPGPSQPSGPSTSYLPGVPDYMIYASVGALVVVAALVFFLMRKK